MHRRTVLLAALLATTTPLLGACGYTPLYAPAEASAIAASRVQVGNVAMSNPERNVGARRVAQRASQRLRQNFPVSGANLDTVTLDIHETDTTLALQKSAAVLRVSLALEGRLVLSAPDGAVLLRTSIATTAPYNIESSPYSTEAGKTYARLTAAQNLADEVSRRLALYYRQHPLAPGATSSTVPVTPETPRTSAPVGGVGVDGDGTDNNSL